MTILDCASKTS